MGAVGRLRPQSAHYPRGPRQSEHGGASQRCAWADTAPRIHQTYVPWARNDPESEGRQMSRWVKALHRTRLDPNRMEHQSRTKGCTTDSYPDNQRLVPAPVHRRHPAHSTACNTSSNCSLENAEHPCMQGQPRTQKCLHTAHLPRPTYHSNRKNHPPRPTKNTHSPTHRNTLRPPRGGTSHSKHGGLAP